MNEGMECFEEMFTMHAVTTLCGVCVTRLPDKFDDSFTSTKDLYRSPSQLCFTK